jgi:hypothetical protein
MVQGACCGGKVTPVQDAESSAGHCRCFSHFLTAPKAPPTFHGRRAPSNPSLLSPTTSIKRVTRPFLLGRIIITYLALGLFWGYFHKIKGRKTLNRSCNDLNTADNVGLSERFSKSTELCNAHMGILNFCFWKSFWLIDWCLILTALGQSRV